MAVKSPIYLTRCFDGDRSIVNLSDDKPADETNAGTTESTANGCNACLFTP